ncbi:MAG TPA: lysophospholipid acyltransferase family protein [Xanthobacteraceae bacterium]|nr:lysophospholipid acyltransferase family protein [Xanthobacteraceae bacterium]
MARTAFAFAVFLVLTALLVILLLALKALRLPGRGAVSTVYSRLVCAAIGLRVTSTGAPVRGRPVLVVANHVSWADILAITATTPALFVAKSEVARWPLIGLVARARPTVFVDRERRRQTGAATADLAARLQDGEAVVLFAEGTSSDGNRVLPFRSALLGAVREEMTDMMTEAATEAGTAAGAVSVAIQPLAIAYTRLHGLPMGRQHRPLAAWYGDFDLLPHLRDFIGRGPMDVTLGWGEPLDAVTARDRKTTTRRLEQEVRSLSAGALGHDSAEPGRPRHG